MHDDIAARYRERIDQFEGERLRLTRREFQLSLTRGGVFLAGGLLSLAALGSSLFGWIVVLTLVVFLALAIYHEVVTQRLAQVTALQRMHRQQLARGQRQWDALPLLEIDLPEEYRFLARDLDLFGKRSIFQWLCVAHTPMGRQTLRDWLLIPADVATIRRRQETVRSLAEHFDWRESLQLHGSLLGPRPADTRQFIEWAEGPGWLTSRRWLQGMAWGIPVAILLTLLAASVGGIPPIVMSGVLAAAILLNATLSVMYSGSVHQIFDQVSGRSNQVRHYRDMLEIVSRLPQQVGHLPLGDADLREVAQRGIVRLGKLQRIIGLANARRDSFYGILHLLAQMTFLWEIHLLGWLERWQKQFGCEAASWFAAIGQIEALASLATAAHDNPHWTFADVDDGTDRLQAIAMGHPLLPDKDRVVNDVELGPPGTFLLVTGSNMSGKTTLLRSLGVNAVLAQAGGVVCADRLRLPPLEVESSMRVADSLADGVSLFLAELRRMKQIVDHAREAQGHQRRLLYLLDEILHGTNSRERQVAVVRVIGHLLQHGAIGAVSTHDLELADAPAIHGSCQVVHFRETLSWEGQQRRMSFDYQLRPGVSPTSNALVLLDMVGLGDEA